MRAQDLLQDYNSKKNLLIFSPRGWRSITLGAPSTVAGVFCTLCATARARSCAPPRVPPALVLVSCDRMSTEAARSSSAPPSRAPFAPYPWLSAANAPEGFYLTCYIHQPHCLHMQHMSLSSGPCFARRMFSLAAFISNADWMVGLVLAAVSSLRNVAMFSFVSAHMASMLSPSSIFRPAVCNNNPIVFIAPFS